MLLWYEQVFVAFPEHQSEAEPFRRLMFDARTDRLKAIKASLGGVQEHHSALDAIVSRVADFTRAVPSQRSLMVTGSLDEILECLQKLTQELGGVVETFGRVALHDDVVLRNVPSIVKTIVQCHSAKTAVQSAGKLSELLGSAYRDVNTDVEAVKHTVQFAQAVASSSLPAKAVRWLLCEDCGTHLEQLRVWLGTVQKCGVGIRAITRNLAALSGAAFWSDNPDGPWGSLQARAEFALANREELPRWNHFFRLQTQSREGGLAKLTALAETQVLEPHEIGPAFRFVFHNTLARSIFTDNAELSQVTGDRKSVV